MNKPKWYVYELADNLGVFYVGKGSGTRYLDSKKDGQPIKVLRAKNCTSTIVAWFEKEADAFDFEKERMGMYPALTNIACYQTLQSLRTYAESIASTVYRNVVYTSTKFGELRQSLANLVDKLSVEIKTCPVVARVKVLVDLLVFAIGKLLRSSKPLSQAESCRLITCSA